MNAEWVQLAGLLAAGAVVLLGARSELRQSSWGPAAWRVLLVAFVVTAVVVAVLIWRRENAPRIDVPAPSGDAISV